MNIHKLIKAKKSLIELGLIKNIRKRSDNNKGFGKCYVKVNFIFKSDFDVLCQNVHSTESEQQKRTVLNTTVYKTAHTLNTNCNNNAKLQTLNSENIPAHVKRKRKVLNTSIANKESEWIERIKQLEDQLKMSELKSTPVQSELFEKDQLITPSQFDLFWELYPSNASKGAALSAWLKLCTQKNKVSIRPTWKVVKTAIQMQIKSELWTKEPQYIPYPSTWLNNNGWLNDANEMKVFKKDVKVRPTEKRSFGFVGKPIKYNEPIEM